MLIVFLLMCQSAISNERARPPSCLVGLCLNGELPTEMDVKNTIGISQKNYSADAIGYCYQFADKNEYGYFLLKKSADVWRLVTIRLSSEPICANPKTIGGGHPLATGEGVSLSSAELDLIKTYGPPKYELRPPSEAIVSDFFIKSPAEPIDLVYQYTPGDVLNALFFMANGRIREIELSADE